MRFFLLIATALAILFPAGRCQGQSPPGVPELRFHLITSENVEEEYSILMSLPEGYDNSEATYSVLYVLDAEKSFGLARDVADWLSWAREIPRMIVVGISYGEGTREWWQKRSRDLTPSQDEDQIWGPFPLAGGAEAFRQFLRSQLFPFIDGQYRTTSDRTLVGLSFGGLFGGHDLLSPDPLFNRYLLVSAAFPWNREVILEAVTRRREVSGSLPARVYTALGGDDEEAIVQTWDRFNNRIASSRFDGLRLFSERFPGESHISVFPVALTHGLKWLFETDGV